jgi:hypothetical protein
MRRSWSSVLRLVQQGLIHRQAGADASRESKQANGDQEGSRDSVSSEPSVKPSLALSSRRFQVPQGFDSIRKNVVCRQNVR